jgi:hypothetical protein
VKEGASDKFSPKGATSSEMADAVYGQTGDVLAVVGGLPNQPACARKAPIRRVSTSVKQEQAQLREDISF